jgi:putative tryptophan/tyrosine transport system substrate-binding protein
MDRREFLGTIAGNLVAAPLATEAQPAAKIYTVGTLSVGFNDDPVQDWWQPFLDAMADLGYVEGRNLVLKRASAGGRPDRLPGLAADLVRAKVDVIVTTAMRETRAARQATSTIPIVMTFAQDPVAYGLVASLARPDGNVTGLTSLVPGLRQKYVQLLKEVLPSASRFAVIATPPGLVPDNLRELEAAIKGFGMSLSLLSVHGRNDFEAALIQARKDGVAGIIATADPVTFEHRRTFVQLVLKHRLPAIYWTREYVDAGGLMTYSANLAGLRRHAATYVDKILKGAKPAELPIEQPTTFELVINLKTAKALGLTIPPSLLLRADQVIE